MSIDTKYRVKEVAADFGRPNKEISEILAKYSEKPKSPTQALTDEELNIVFDYMTQHNQIASLEVVFAVQPKPAEPKPEPAKEAPKQEQKPAKPAEPERKRERRVVDTSAVQVNTNRFADVDNLVSEKVQNYQGGKQKFGKKGQQKNQKQEGKFKGNKARNEAEEKLRRLQMEVARKAPVTVKIPEAKSVSPASSAPMRKGW